MHFFCSFYFTKVEQPKQNVSPDKLLYLLPFKSLGAVQSIAAVKTFIILQKSQTEKKKKKKKPIQIHENG